MFGPGAGEGAVFAYQFGAGVGYAVAESVVLSLDYRSFVASGADVDVFTGASSDLDFMTSTIWMGLRYEF